MLNRRKARATSRHSRPTPRRLALVIAAVTALSTVTVVAGASAAWAANCPTSVSTGEWAGTIDITSQAWDGTFTFTPTTADNWSVAGQLKETFPSTSPTISLAGTLACTDLELTADTNRGTFSATVDPTTGAAFSGTFQAQIFPLGLHGNWSGAFLPSTVFVDPGGSDTAGCGAATHPCASLNFVASLLPPSTTPHTVQLAAGTYPNTHAIIQPNVTMTIQGDPSTPSILDGGNAGTVITNTGDGNLTMRNVTVQHGSGCVGGIDNFGTLTMSHDVVQDNAGGTAACPTGHGQSGGGGVSNDQAATMALDHNLIQRNLNGGVGNVSGTATSVADTITDNHGSRGFTIGNGMANYTISATFPATMTAAGDTISGNSSSEGGGVANSAASSDLNADSQLILYDSTISGNTATGIGAPAEGGGIANDGTLGLINDTIVNNLATGASSLGGGIYTDDTSASVYFTTITGNTAGLGGGVYALANLSLYADAIGANTETQGGTACWALPVSALQDGGYNVDEDGGCLFNQPTDRSGVGDLQLMPLASYGGTTETRPPQRTSSLIDLGASCVPIDQRGLARPQGASCDSGAVELALPSTADYTYNVAAGSPLHESAGTLLAQISDVNPQVSSWTAQAATQPQHGTVTVNADGSFVYTPTAGYLGADSFAYTVTDNYGFVSPPATVSLNIATEMAIGDSSTYEGGIASFPITLNRVAPSDVTVTVTVGGGNAVNGTGLKKGVHYDYKTAVTRTVTIKQGHLVAYVNVPTVQDAVTDGTQTFNVTLSNTVGALVVRSVGGGTILDDTSTPAGQLLFGTSSIVETDTGEAAVKVSVVLSKPDPTNTVTVQWTLASTDTTAGTDFVAKTKPAILTFKPGLTQKLVAVTVIGDTTQESAKHVAVVFSTPANATFGPTSQGTAVILDND